MKKSKFAAAILPARGKAEKVETPPAEKMAQPGPFLPKRRFHTTVYPDSKEMYDNIRIALIREGKDRDFNRLVNDLLTEWLDARTDEDER